MPSSICAYDKCRQPFTSLRPRECCNRSCAARLAQTRRGLTPWEPDALHWLEQTAGTLPFPDLCRRFRMMAKRRGWATRSDNALHVKIQRLNLQKKCTEDNLTRRELARFLNIPPDRVRNWTSNGLPWRKVARNQSAIQMADLKAFLLANPERATNVPERELGWLIGDEAAARIVAAEHSARGYHRPILCIDTGEIFPSVRAAARAKYVTRGCICQAIRRGGKSAGLRWAYLDELNAGEGVSYG